MFVRLLRDRIIGRLRVAAMGQTSSIKRIRNLTDGISYRDVRFYEQNGNRVRFGLLAVQTKLEAFRDGQSG